MNAADKEILAVLQEHLALKADRYGRSYKEEKQRYLDDVRKQNAILKGVIQLQTTS